MEEGQTKEGEVEVEEGQTEEGEMEVEEGEVEVDEGEVEVDEGEVEEEEGKVVEQGQMKQEGMAGKDGKGRRKRRSFGGKLCFENLRIQIVPCDLG